MTTQASFQQQYADFRSLEHQAYHTMLRRQSQREMRRVLLVQPTTSLSSLESSGENQATLRKDQAS